MNELRSIILRSTLYGCWKTWWPTWKSTRWWWLDTGCSTNIFDFLNTFQSALTRWLGNDWIRFNRNARGKRNEDKKKKKRTENSNKVRCSVPCNNQTHTKKKNQWNQQWKLSAKEKKKKKRNKRKTNFESTNQFDRSWGSIFCSSYFITSGLVELDLDGNSGGTLWITLKKSVWISMNTTIDSGVERKKKNDGEKGMNYSRN